MNDLGIELGMTSLKKQCLVNNIPLVKVVPKTMEELKHDCMPIKSPKRSKSPKRVKSPKSPKQSPKPDVLTRASPLLTRASPLLTRASLLLTRASPLLKHRLIRPPIENWRSMSSKLKPLRAKKHKPHYQKTNIANSDIVSIPSSIGPDITGRVRPDDIRDISQPLRNPLNPLLQLDFDKYTPLYIMSMVMIPKKI